MCFMSDDACVYCIFKIVSSCMEYLLSERGKEKRCKTSMCSFLIFWDLFLMPTRLCRFSYFMTCYCQLKVFNVCNLTRFKSFNLYSSRCSISVISQLLLFHFFAIKMRSCDSNFCYQIPSVIFRGVWWTRWCQVRTMGGWALTPNPGW